MTQIDTQPTTGRAMPALQALHHVSLTVSDIERSEAWYSGVLGFERLMVEPHHGGTGYAVVLHRPGTPIFIGLEHHTTGARASFDERNTGLDHVAIGVVDRAELDRWVEHLDAAGVAHSGVNHIEQPFPFATLIIRDPDNIQLELTWMA